MPDIQIKCESCSEITTVSEYADANSIVCGKCGDKLSKPTAGLKLKQRPTVRRQTVPQAAEEQPTPQHTTVLIDAPNGGNSGAVQTNTKPQQQVRKAKPTQLIASIAIFLVMGLIMGWIRYGDALSGPNLEKFTEYGPFAMITIHLTIFILVSKESIFSGLLCLLVPFYGLYYVFFVSDAFLLRAIIAGVLVGIGEDSFFFFKDLIIGAFQAADNWIRHGALH